MSDLLSGANILAAAAIGVYFVRFWRKSRDRLFLGFAVAFWMLGANRLGLSLIAQEQESRTLYYLIRLGAFVLILIAIWDKNRHAAVTRVDAARLD